ncbi:hypothetical protein GCM10010441_50800 [Kitasatospora paracochleata]|uniref:Integral membrane protein n=1 Tax=Kitasatospora paracochleata TaxID=58354 RepID=A0ABT1IQV8_9ACTN|nr:hypothetical protein [Kitasatospora paracochleata]MCP2307523.1 hypothetical protein [Kitasatospora paracochleata]
MTAESTTPAATRPTPLLAGAAITALEGAALAGWGLYDLVAGLFGDSAALGRSEMGGGVLLLMGLLPLLAGRALLKARRWGRTPALLTNSICLPVAYYMWQAGGVAAGAGVVVALLGVAGIVTLLNPKVTTLLYG